MNLNRLSYLVLACIAIVLVVFAYWTVQSPKVLKVHNSPTPVFPPEVQAGTSAVFLDINYCKYYDTHGKVSVFLVGQTTASKIAVNWPEDKTPKGCSRLKQVPILIPPQTATDTYIVEFTVEYGNVNPLKKGETSMFRSGNFKVVNPKLQPGDAKPVIP